MIHTLSVLPPFLDAIGNGTKRVEGRINDGKAATFKPGDSICFSGAITCRITKIEPYTSFKAMLDACGFKNCIPNATTIEEAIAVYNSIPGYTDRVKKYGCLAIYIEEPT